MTQTAAPLRSRMALVPMVVPCTSRSVAGSATSSLANACRRPCVGSLGSVGDFRGLVVDDDVGEGATHVHADPEHAPPPTLEPRVSVIFRPAARRGRC